MPQQINYQSHLDALANLRLGVEMDQHNLPDAKQKLAALDLAISTLSHAAIFTAVPGAKLVQLAPDDTVKIDPSGDVTTILGPGGLSVAARIVESIAQQWDGCQYDSPGETIDIGESIRQAGKRLISDARAGEERA